MTETTLYPDFNMISMRRRYRCSAALLFAAHSQPEHLMRWFGPQPYPLTTCEVDFRVGGSFRFAMTGPDGVQGPFFGGSYREITADRRIVYDNGFHLEGAERMLTLFTFEDRGSETELTMITIFGSAAMYTDHVGMGFAEGVGIGMDQLAAHLAIVQAA